MKNSLDKYSKVGTLSLHLQKYELSPKFNHTQQKSSQIQSQQIVYPSPPKVDAEMKIPIKSVSREKVKRESVQKSRKTSTLKFTSEKSNYQNEFQDEDQIFNKCLTLTSRIEVLKKEKLEYAFHQFEQEQRKKMEYLLEKQKKTLNFKYNEKRAELKSSYQKQTTRIVRALQDINNFKTAYLTIFQDLAEKRNKLNKQYVDSVEKIHELKDKLISQWKRSSNQEIMKKTNKQF